MELPGHVLRATGLVIHELTALVLVETLGELRRIQHVHAVRPTVVSLLDQTILIVAFGAERRFVTAQRQVGTELMIGAKETTWDRWLVTWVTSCMVPTSAVLATSRYRRWSVADLIPSPCCPIP